MSGNEDVKSQDDKGSDSGEIDSPASQNHPSHSNPFGEGNKEIQESSSSNAGVSSNVGTTQKVGLASEKKNGTVQYESIKGSLDDDHSCSSSSSSSDDESVDATKKPEVCRACLSAILVKMICLEGDLLIVVFIIIILIFDFILLNTIFIQSKLIIKDYKCVRE